MDGLEIVGADDVLRCDEDSSIWRRLERRFCNGCGRQFGLNRRRLKICGRCRHPHVHYCSVACQEAHWEKHWETCFYERKIRRRKCVICARGVEYKDPPFPVCECGTRVYCGEACQAQDWAAGHSTQHAFLASFLGEDLDEEVRTILRRWAKTSMKRCGR